MTGRPPARPEILGSNLGPARRLTATAAPTHRSCHVRLSTPQPRHPQPVPAQLPATSGQPKPPVMHRCHVDDHDFDLMLDATDAAGQQWTAIMDPDEAYELARRATHTATTNLSLDDLRSLVIDVTGRDPCP